MNLKLISAILSALLSVVLFIPYFRDIFRKKTQPHMYSWLIWGLLQLIGTAAILKAGAGYGVLSLLIGGIFCLLIFALSFAFGTKNIKPFDTYCLIGATIALIAYLFIKDPLYSVLLVTITDFLAFLPTFRKGYEEPESETALTFFLSAVSVVLALYALNSYSVTTVLYLASLCVTNMAIVVILLARKRTAVLR